MHHFSPSYESSFLITSDKVEAVAAMFSGESRKPLQRISNWTASTGNADSLRNMVGIARVAPYPGTPIAAGTESVSQPLQELGDKGA